MLSLLFKDSNLPGIYIVGAAIIMFVVTFILTLKLMHKLPGDIGRAYAVNAEKAKGKPRGAGIIFVTCFCILSFIFAPFDIEYSVYLILLMFTMMTGFLDDASKIPWSDYKKGLLDLLISVGVAITFAANNSTLVEFKLISTIIRQPVTVELPYVVYVILATILIWMAINVVNCTDGVDGLCTSLSIICFLTFLVITKDSIIVYEILFIAAMAAYLWFNSSPSQILMGDAGSRTIGVFLAIAAMKCGDPFLFLPICIVFIVDGGIGLVKIFLKRFLKISILKNTQTVMRFCIIQLVISISIFILLCICGNYWFY